MTISAEQIVANMAPRRIVDGSTERLHWAVRFVSPLEVDLDEGALGMALNQAVADTMAAALRDSGLSADSDEGKVVVRFRIVDSWHAVVVVESIILERDVAHAWLVGASAALSALHRRWPIEDVQGTPRAMWRLVVTE